MKLLTSGMIGSLTIPNRVIMAPLSTNFPSVSGEVTPELIAFYLERARGGVGMIILEWANVDFPLGKSGYTQMRIDDDCFVPSLRELTEIIHETDTKICLQLNHAGGMFGDRGRSDLSPISASPLVYGKNHRLAREATVDEIHEIQEKFILGAQRAKMAGFDAIELHGATSYLISNFLSPWTNLRTDEYGGSTENRARFAVEIVQGIRRVCGPTFPILFRISGDEMVEEGRHLDETVQIVSLLKAAGVDCAHVTAGASRDPSLLARRAHIGPMGYPQGWKSYLAREIGTRCQMTTIAVGTIRDVEVAEQIVNEDADFVAMARQLIAEPHWVAKAAAGIPVRKCISCNTCVLYRSMYGGKLRCCVNPMAGKEYRLTPPEAHPATDIKRVAVVGGGPAGMEAARVASLRGHQVTLFERSATLGGKLIAAAGTDLKYKIAWLHTWQESELHRQKVDIRLNCPITGPDDLAEFDVAILATGSLPRMRPTVAQFVQTHPEDPRLLFAEDYLSGAAALPDGAQAVCVLGAGLSGCESAYLLAKNGMQVTLVTASHTKENLVPGIDSNNAGELTDALAAHGVDIWDHTSLEELEEEHLLLLRNGVQTQLPYQAIVLAQGYSPDRSLEVALEGADLPAFVIGDAYGVRDIFHAVHEGFTRAYYL